MNRISGSLITGFSICIALLAATAMLYWRSAETNRANVRGLAEHHQVVSGLQDATLNLYVADRAQRDFVSNGTREALEASQTGLFGLERALSKASGKLREDGSRLAFDRIGQALSQQVLLLQRAFEAVAAGQRQQAVVMLEAPQALARMADIGRQMDSLRAAESKRLDMLSHDLEEGEKAGRRWLYTCAGLATLLFVGLGLLVQRELSRREKAEASLTRQERTLRGVLREMQDGILVLGPESQVLEMNPAAEQMMGIRPQRFDLDFALRRGLYLNEACRPLSPGQLPLERALAGESLSDARLYLRDNEGSGGMHLSVSANPVRDELGQLFCAVAVLRDISMEHLDRQKSQQVQAKLGETVRRVEAKNIEIGLLGGLTRHLQACQTVEELCTACDGALKKLLPGLDGTLNILNNSKTMLLPQLAWDASGQLSKGDAFSPQDCWAIRRGQPHGIRPDRTGPRCQHLVERNPAWSLCQPLAGQGEVLGVLTLCSDAVPESVGAVANLISLISEQLGMGLANLRLRESLHNQSIHDPLTGLYNRRYLDEVVDREFDRARRSHSPLTLLAFDVDHFKTYNDQNGHDAGDQVLRQLSQCMRECARSSDVICRVGGEELVVLMPEADLIAAEGYYNSLQQALKELNLFYMGRRLEPITVSAGAAAFPRDGENFTTLMQHADNALYDAKRMGRNRLVLWPQMAA